MFTTPAALAPTCPFIPAPLLTIVPLPQTLPSLKTLIQTHIFFRLGCSFPSPGVAPALLPTSRAFTAHSLRSRYLFTIQYLLTLKHLEAGLSLAAPTLRHHICGLILTHWSFSIPPTESQVLGTQPKLFTVSCLSRGKGSYST